MSTQRILKCLAVVVVGLALPLSVSAQPPQSPVTEFQNILRKDVGAWNAEVKLWMNGPDGEPMVSKAVEKNRSIGEIWIITEFKGDVGGQKFEGHGQYGYNSRTKKYTGTWIDSMNNEIAIMEGTWNADKKELTMFRPFTEPDGSKVQTKSITSYTDAYNKTWAMYKNNPDGTWLKFMEITYKRRVKKKKQE